MKSIVVYDRVKSRDIYYLIVLTRDHGYTLDDIFAAIDAYQPIRNKDPEHFKSVVTGVIPVDKNDEGVSSIQTYSGIPPLKGQSGLRDRYRELFMGGEW